MKPRTRKPRPAQFFGAETQRVQPRTRAVARTKQRRDRARNHYDRIRQLEEQRGLRRKIGYAVLALTLALGLAAAPYVEAHFLEWLGNAHRLEQIAVQGHERLSAEAIALASGVVPGAALASVDAAAAAVAIESDPWIERASARLGPEGTLLIGIVERRPSALLAPSEGGKAWRALDVRGEAFADAQLSQWPQVAQLHSDAVPEPAALTRAMQLAAQLEAAGLRGPLRVEIPSAHTADDKSDVAISSSSWHVHSEAPHTSVELADDLLEEGIDQLEQLLASGVAARESERAGVEAALEIDLRFRDRAILRTGSPPRPPMAAGEQDLDRSEKGTPREEAAQSGGGPGIRHSAHHERVEDSAAHGG